MQLRKNNDEVRVLPLWQSAIHQYWKLDDVWKKTLGEYTREVEDAVGCSHQALLRNTFTQDQYTGVPHKAIFNYGGILGKGVFCKMLIQRPKSRQYTFVFF